MGKWRVLHLFFETDLQRMACLNPTPYSDAHSCLDALTSKVHSGGGVCCQGCNPRTADHATLRISCGRYPGVETITVDRGNLEKLTPVECVTMVYYYRPVKQ